MLMKCLIFLFLLAVASGDALAHVHGGQGYIDFQFLSADYDRYYGNTYMTLCLIKNGAYPPPLPIHDHRICHATCSSRLSSPTTHPVWRQTCLPSASDPLYTEQSRAVVEVWSTKGVGYPKRFLGGNTITIREVLDAGLNGRSWKFPLIGGDARGDGICRLNWTPRG